MAGKAERLKQELLALQSASRDRMLHPEKVVAWAKAHRKSALYTQFEWNDGKAASEYRIWQARRLIQITVVHADGGPQLVSLSTDRSKGGGYRDVGDIAKSRSLSEIMLQDAINELNRVQARFQRVKELTAMWHEFERVKKARATPTKKPAKAA